MHALGQLSTTFDCGTAVACKKKDVLKLQLADYKSVANDIEQGLFKAARLLAREKIFDDSNLPYSTQLIPLSAICAQLGDRFEEDPVRKKLTRWFWSGVFGELYGGANEGRYAFDLPDVTVGLVEARSLVQYAMQISIRRVYLDCKLETVRRTRVFMLC